MRLLVIAAAVGACDANGPGFGGSGGTPSTGGSDYGGGGGTDTASTDTGATDTGTTDSGNTDSGNTDSGNTDSGDTDSGGTPQGTGYDEGDVAYDLVAPNQAGAYWSLYGQLGTPVVLVVGDADNSSMTTTMQAASEVEDSGVGAAVAVLIGRDEFSTASTQAAAQRLAEDYGLSMVMYDSGGEIVSTWAERNPPKTYVIDASMNIVWTRFGIASSGDILNALDAR